MSKITYADKVTLNENPNVADVNKVRADDLNEIKNVVNANDDKFNYTQEEQRIGTWIDGKPIYRKIITKTSFTVGETTNTHGISNIDFIVNVRGVGIRADGEQEFLPTVVPPSGMQYYQISIYDVNKTHYRMYMGSNTQTGAQKLETLYLIFEYTKTTD